MNAVVCRCGEEAMLRTSRKDNANKGRRFYGCARFPKPQHCSFFRWECDNAVETAAPLCKEHQRKCLIRCVKQGANCGRRFYACSSSDYKDSCGFQKWVEAPPAQNKTDVSLTNPLVKLSAETLRSRKEALDATLQDRGFVDGLPDRGKKLRMKLNSIVEALKIVQDRETKLQTSSGPLTLLSTRPASALDDLEKSFASMKVGSRTTSEDEKKEKKEHDPLKQVQSLFDSLSLKSASELDRVQVNPALLCSLYPHQQFALNWMVARERTPPNDQPRGGIIADDMGLGKTMQILALLVTNTRSHFHVEPAKAGSATLIVCPLAVLPQWQSEIKKHVRADHLAVNVFHGQNRSSNLKDLRNSDVVLTTFSTVLSSLKSKKNKSTASSPACLHDIKWLRIVLDEAHMIKNAKSKTASAIYELESLCRWFMSATPVQNDIDDLFSAFKFLRANPYNDFKHWKSLFDGPALSKNLQLLQALVNASCIRRTKSERDETGQALVKLPDRVLQVHALEFNEQQRSRYDVLRGKCSNSLNQYNRNRFRPNAGQKDSAAASMNYGQVLCSLLRLRQACNGIEFTEENGDSEDEKKSVEPVEDEVGLDVAFRKLTLDSTPNSKHHLQRTLTRLKGHDVPSSADAVEHADNASSFECPICFEVLPRGSKCSVTQCGHVFCLDCSAEILDQAASTCPVCRKKIAANKIATVIIGGDGDTKPLVEAHEDSDDVVSSPKVKFLLDQLEVIRTKSPDEKSIVFSQWTTMLDLLEAPLRKAGYGFARLDGTLSRQARQTEMQRFEEDDDVVVFLLSLKCAGVGLNLCRANHVFAMDVWWNFAAEEQAFDRVYRIGQTREVFVHRLVIKDSVEERILELQDRKRRIAKNAFSEGGKLGQKSNASKHMFSFDELKDLLGISK